jgi:hypothetical protein
MRKLIFGFLALGLITASCNSDDSDDSMTISNLTVNLSGLEDLGAASVYEGWLIVEGSPVSTGVFTVDASGVLSRTTFQVETTALAAATKFVLSIEPSNDPDPAPSDQKLLAGDFDGNAATVSTGVAPAIGDFSQSSGSFFLRTPTDENDGVNNGNDQNGVWFGLPGAPPSSNFVLPTLPVGWIYEGWVVTDNGPISTGVFTSFDTMDAFNGFSGMNPGPPLAGEDFFNNAPNGFIFPLDVRNKTVVISIEPVPDNSLLPFLLKPLVGNAGTDTAPVSYPFNYNEASFPTGNITR